MKCQTVWTLIGPEQNVGPDLGPNCLQRLSADDMSGKVLMQKVKYYGFRASVRRTYAVYYVQKSAAYAKITHQRRTADF